MPTGYTTDIAKGISFEKFVLNCARAFGALIAAEEMRDAVEELEKQEKRSAERTKWVTDLRKSLK